MNPLMLAVLRGVLMREVWETNRHALSDDLFTSTDVRTLVAYVGELHEERLEGDLDPNDLRMKIESKYRRPDGRKAELLDLVGLVAHTSPLAPNELQPLIADFAQRELAVKAATYVASHQDSDNFDIHKPYDMLTRAVEVASGLDLDIEDLSTAPPPDFLEERKGVVTVGLGEKFDGILGGGVGEGEMLFWLAPPGVGKTSFLINQCVAVALRGANVLHITLEIKGAKCRQRIDQRLTGLTRDERFTNIRLVMAARKQLTGKIYVKDWAHAHVTVDDIRTLVKRMRAQGLVVDAVSVDYLELLAPVSSNRHGERFNHAQTAKDLRRLGNELDVVMISAWQVNRAGASKHVLSDTDVSECWDIVKHADIIIGLNQNEMELENKLLRANIIKQREGTARPIEYFHSDLDRMIIKPTVEEGDSDDDPEEVDSRD